MKKIRLNLKLTMEVVNYLITGKYTISNNIL